MPDVIKSVVPVHLSGENVIHRLKVILLKLSLNGPVYLMVLLAVPGPVLMALDFAPLGCI